MTLNTIIETQPLSLITGASSGLGRAAAIRLSPARRLLLNGRNLARLEETRAQCARPQEHILWPFDLSQTGGLSAALANVLAGDGAGVNAFVHCAGTVTVLPARSLEPGAMLSVMSTNFLSAAEIVRTLLRKSVNRAGLQSIVFISSIWSAFGARGHSAYCASKAALDGYMRALALELAPHARVNSILPGAIRTTMAEHGFQDPAIIEGFQRDYPLGLGQPGDIADAIEFLLSDKSRWITGQQIAIDGGRTINMSLK
jgi:NAD(P)-dependent dehydrogenase (short-subunit alcohol dehydrogenase family)